MLLLSLALLLLFIGLLTYYLFILQQRYQYFIRRNIPTPPFDFFFGHVRRLWSVTSHHRQLESWTKQYGKIYGLYEGSIPVFVVSDVDFLQEVFIKQFSVFFARRATLFDSITSDLFFSFGPRWRRQRHLINPTFTAAKLKSMSPLINECIGDLMKKLSEHVENRKEFDIYLYYKRMTMDVICRCAFGIDTDLQNDPENIYLKKAKELFDHNPLEKGLLLKAAQVVPEIGTLLAWLFSITNKTSTFINTRLLPLVSSTLQLNEMPIMWLRNRLHAIVEQRRLRPIARVDLLQLMLQVTTNKSIDDISDNDKANYRLTQDEVTGNIFVFMAAGYETSSTALAYATYELARRPDILHKLQTEIDQLPLSTDDDDADEESKKYPDYDIVAQMPYMDLFISEVLRMYPIGNRAIQRRAIENAIVHGIKIDKGSLVYPDIYSIHFDRELWGPEDPYHFVPERHQTKRHPMAYLPFGAGPRICIGMRFALIEMKMVLTRLLLDFTILPGEELEKKFVIRDQSSISPTEVWIKLEKRQRS